jgi:hypothetical protein
MDISSTVDGAAAARQARFGRLPERVSPADMVEEKPAGSRDRAGDAYNAEASWMNFNCLAVDLGL